MAREFGSYSPTVPVAATWEETITFQDEDGNAVDLTGYEVECQLRPTLLTPSELNLTSENGDWTIPTPDDGTIYLEVEPEELAPLLEGAVKRKLLWGIVLRRTSDDYRIPLVKGKVTFTLDAVQYDEDGVLAE